MKTLLRISLTLLMLLASFALAAPARAAEPNFAVVTWGDDLHHIAARFGVTAEELARTNKLPSLNFIYAGQILLVPEVRVESAALESFNAAAPIVAVYVVRYGDNLNTIARRYGMTVNALLNANGIRNPNFIYAGQRLNIPGKNSAAAQPVSAVPARASGSTELPATASNRAANPPTTGKWIEVDISDQTITGYQGSAALKKVLVSTGVAWFPTPLGTYKIYTKIRSQTMSGGNRASGMYYYLPGVPWVMYFYQGYAIHGTYWHRNFGKPMSHGCVNLTIEDSKWFFEFAEIGTPVVVRF